MAQLIRSTLKPALAIAIAAALLFPLPAAAQTLYGSIVGTVSDAQGAAIPGATITATNDGTGHKVEAVSDSDGHYSFRNLLPGVYTLGASLQGFRELHQTGLRVSANTAVRVELKLEVGALTETVNVISDTTLLQTEKADLSTELTSKDVVNLPLNSFRNYQTLLNLVPGATPGQLQNAEIDTPGRALSTSVNGMQRNSNAFRIDGAVSVNLWLPHHVGYVNPAETIDTVNISTNNFSVDQGMAAGAAVNVITKSGTNQLHGSAFFFRTQDELNANTFFNNANNLAKPNLSTNIYGGTLGGPIMKDKLFFFGSWERYQNRRGVQQTFTVPTARMRVGDFSEVNAAYPAFRLYNPYTGSAGGVGRQQFTNNAIPSNLLSPTSQSILAAWPSPNTATDLNANGLSDDYVRGITVKNDRDNFDVKLTWQRTPSHSIWAKFGMLDAEVIDNFILGFDQGSFGDTRVYNGTIGHTWTISPSLVLDGYFGMNRQDQSVTGPDYGTNYGLDFGIPGTNGASERYSGLPYIGAGYEFGTTPNWMPLFRKEQSFTFSSAVTKVLPKHELRFGIDVVRHELNHYQAEFGTNGGVRGALTSGTTITATPGYVPLQWNQFGGVPARAAVLPEQGRAGDPDDGPRVADGGLPRRPLAGGVEAHPEPGPARRALPAHDPRGRQGTRAAGLQHVPGLRRRLRLDAAGRGHQREVVVLRPAPGRDVPAHREHGAPRRVRADHQSPAVVAADARLLPVRHLLQQDRGAVRLARHARRRHPAGSGARSQQRRRSAAAQHLHALAEPDRRRSRDPAAGERGRRAPLPGRHLGRDGLRARPLGRRLRRPQPELRRARRRTGRSPVLLGGRHVGHHGLGQPHQAALQRAPGRHQPSVQERPAVEGRLHPEQGPERDRRGRMGEPALVPPVEARSDNFALSGEDRTHVFQMGFVYELPFAKQSKGVLASIVKNWQLNGIVAAYSGTPWSVPGTNNALNCQGCSSIGTLINVSGDPSPTRKRRLAAPSPGTTSRPSRSRPGTGIDGFGTSKRNQFRSPSVWNFDLGLFRSFPVGRFRPELRIEATNVFNHTNWGRPVRTFTDPRFMTFIPAAAHEVGTIFGHRHRRAPDPDRSATRVLTVADSRARPVGRASGSITGRGASRRSGPFAFRSQGESTASRAREDLVGSHVLEHAAAVPLGQRISTRVDRSQPAPVPKCSGAGARRRRSRTAVVTWFHCSRQRGSRAVTSFTHGADAVAVALRADEPQLEPVALAGDSFRHSSAGSQSALTTTSMRPSPSRSPKAAPRWARAGARVRGRTSAEASLERPVPEAPEDAVRVPVVGDSKLVDARRSRGSWR